MKRIREWIDDDKEKVDHVSLLPLDIWRCIIDYVWHDIVCYVGSKGIYHTNLPEQRELLFYRKKPFATLSMSRFLRKKLFYGAGLVRFALFDMLYLRRVEFIKWEFVNRVILPPSLFFFRPYKETLPLLRNKKFYETFSRATPRGMKNLYEALELHEIMMRDVTRFTPMWTRWTKICQCLYCKEILHDHTDDDDYFDEYDSSDENERVNFFLRKKIGQ